MDRQRGSVAEVWRVKMIEPKPLILGTSRAYRETVADERTGTASTGCDRFMNKGHDTWTN